MATGVTTEVTLAERSTLTVVATAARDYEGDDGYSAELRPSVSPSPVGFIQGPLGRVVSGLAYPSDSTARVASGALTYVVTLDPGTYVVGVDVWQSADGPTGLQVSVSVVVGCDTGVTTIYGGE